MLKRNREIVFVSTLLGPSVLCPIRRQRAEEDKANIVPKTFYWNLWELAEEDVW